MADLGPDVDGWNHAGGVSDVAPEVGSDGEGEAQERAFKVLFLRELLDQPDPEWLIDGVIQRGSLVMVYGPPSCGKTFFVLDLVLRIVIGSHWCGCEVVSGVVLYVAAEASVGIKSRVKAWVEPLIDDAENPLYSGFAVIGEAVHLLDPIDVTGLLNAINGMPVRPDVVVLDTLARCIAGGDENHAKDMGEFIAAADVIRRQIGSTVILVHHTRKDSQVERGSSALRGAVDTSIKVEKTENVVTVRCDKQKDAVEFEPKAFELMPVEIGFDHKGRGLTSCKLVPTGSPRTGQGGLAAESEHADAIIAALRDDFFPEDGAPWTRLLAASGVPEGSFGRLLKELVEAGRVRKKGAGRSSRYFEVLPPEDGSLSLSRSDTITPDGDTEGRASHGDITITITPPLKGRADSDSDSEADPEDAVEASGGSKERRKESGRRRKASEPERPKKRRSRRRQKERPGPEEGPKPHPEDAS